ncbi:hypothetical protein NHQ30_002686 [Ciborinia camelliae]|nr:hypothetical protein NHQ30_002686 [Ciborinia camelliae]
MASRRSKLLLPRTALAEIYGHSKEPPLPGVIPLKSGLTPVIPRNASISEKQFADDVRWMQRQRYSSVQSLVSDNQSILLADFTTAELQSFDALAPLYKESEGEGMDDTSADIAIHPAIRREKWNAPLPKHLAEFPLGEDRDGYWNAYTNDLVWEAMLPAIRIASLYLSNADLWPWYDALFATEWIDIPEEEIPKDATRQGWKRFFCRDPFVYGSEQGRRNVRDKILDLSKDIHFYLSCGYTDPTSGVKRLESDAGTIGGETVLNLAHNIILIRLSFEPIEALFPGNIERLNVAEIAMVHVDLAISILHEFTHALYQLDSRIRYPDYKGKELYYERDVVSELGMSEVSSFHVTRAEERTDKSRYGVQSVEYTKVIGTELELDRYGYPRRFAREPFVEFEGIPNQKRQPGSDTHRLEDSEPLNKRRRVHAVVRTAHTLRDPLLKKEDELQKQREASKSDILSASVDFGDDDLPQCPRFDEISTYLINNRRQLALHTMCFVMPEHTLVGNNPSSHALNS